MSGSTDKWHADGDGCDDVVVVVVVADGGGDGDSNANAGDVVSASVTSNITVTSGRIGYATALLTVCTMRGRGR